MKYSNEKIIGLSVKFFQSDIDPRDDDNLTKMVCFHNKYIIGDKHDYNRNDYSSWKELKADIMKNEDVVLIKPLYAYIHGGVTISTEPFSCGWDSGQVGYIYVTRQQIESHGVDEKEIERILNAEVNTYKQYLCGDVYGFMCYKDGKVVDSCGGFYGRNVQTNGMLSHMSGEFAALIENVEELELDDC